MMPGHQSTPQGNGIAYSAWLIPEKQVKPAANLDAKSLDHLHPHRILIRPFGKVLKSPYKLEIN